MWQFQWMVPSDHERSLQAFRIVTLLTISVARMHRKLYQAHIPPKKFYRAGICICWARKPLAFFHGIQWSWMMKIFGLTSCSISHLDKRHVVLARERRPGLCPWLHPCQSIHPLTLLGFPCPSSSSQICVSSPLSPDVCATVGDYAHAQESSPCPGLLCIQSCSLSLWAYPWGLRGLTGCSANCQK